MPDYKTGTFRTVNKFFLWKTLKWEQTDDPKTIIFRFAIVKQELILRYKASIPERFGELAPTPKKIWRSIAFL